ncbi:hypothetical protein M427DRAFT_429952 [Gonapodya prolifera JEL478]|uniref:Uncharacterized protein n=1 Tax=Gonapodya prolifera (strain JEL478) TaxID=1344416 RepID=A0A139ASR9_GONPJ|nr:hypothetical protein M427DRAFT_429952 [Gonapodya prolifera JEL478]|eukprot:KXS19786.1 hypothetical protein M427DRAFT_429952 [Gonapodya prolifera JEL478]
MLSFNATMPIPKSPSVYTTPASTPKLEATPLRFSQSHSVPNRKLDFFAPNSFQMAMAELCAALAVLAPHHVPKAVEVLEKEKSRLDREAYVLKDAGLVDEVDELLDGGLQESCERLDRSFESMRIGDDPAQALSKPDEGVTMGNGFSGVHRFWE